MAPNPPSDKPLPRSLTCPRLAAYPHVDPALLLWKHRLFRANKTLFGHLQKTKKKVAKADAVNGFLSDFLKRLSDDLKSTMSKLKKKTHLTQGHVDALNKLRLEFGGLLQVVCINLNTANVDTWKLMDSLYDLQKLCTTINNTIAALEAVQTDDTVAAEQAIIASPPEAQPIPGPSLSAESVITIKEEKDEKIPIIYPMDPPPRPTKQKLELVSSRKGKQKQKKREKALARSMKSSRSPEPSTDPVIKDEEEEKVSTTDPTITTLQPRWKFKGVTLKNNFEAAMVMRHMMATPEPVLKQNGVSLKKYFKEISGRRHKLGCRQSNNTHGIITAFLEGLDNDLYRRRIARWLKHETYEWHWLEHVVNLLIEEEKYFEKQDYALAHQFEDGSVLLPDGTIQRHFVILEPFTEADLSSSDEE
ncbi:hypothetical protein N7520_003937 [Penicillium odoratum]|uniref:uncharacterized protein n=1 Tax=Penicillium odoratum TaxID=1167516 RepID=UPI0025474463|nr:uncharacterized protein N7520_003937 [Penicillium odoratum]KAJ5769378.1 hypothetical protein N7520_003937 [Penicillium odoratum]